MSGRLIDIPYWTSPPLVFTYRETALLGAVVPGEYTFVTALKAAFTPSRPIRPNALYAFDTFDFSMDVAEIDYQGAISVLPEFSMFLQSDSAGPTLREPIPLAKYFQTLPYRLHILGSELLEAAYPGQNAVTPTQGYSFNRLLGSVGGTLTQTAALSGKASVTAIIVFTVQEVVDEDFVSSFKALAGGKSSYRPGKAF
jgi:hypothetical protein